MKKLVIIVIGSIIIFIIGLTLIRGNEDEWICQDGEWTKHGNPAAQKPRDPCKISKQTDYNSTPEGLVSTFYSWYLNQPNGLQVYKNSQYLSEGFKMKVENISKSNEQGSYDPIFLNQDLPQTFSIKDTVVEGSIARVYVSFVFSDQTRQLVVALEKQKGNWLITDILPDDETKNQTETTRKVLVYFPNVLKSSGTGECDSVFGVERLVGKYDGYDAVLRQLFMGPNKLERDDGYTSFFSKETDGILISLKIEVKTAYVNLQDIRTIIPNASASCGSQSFFAQVNKTLIQENKVTNVIFAINGDPEPFYEWMQIGCVKENNFCDKEPFENDG